MGLLDVFSGLSFLQVLIKHITRIDIPEKNRDTLGTACQQAAVYFARTFLLVFD